MYNTSSVERGLTVVSRMRVPGVVIPRQGLQTRVVPSPETAEVEHLEQGAIHRGVFIKHGCKLTYRLSSQGRPARCLRRRDDSL